MAFPRNHNRCNHSFAAVMFLARPTIILGYKFSRYFAGGPATVMP
jgi:hypothetical protein